MLNNLDLWCNEIGDAGATALGEALKVNAVLTDLNLHANDIGPTGATALADALKFNAVLNNLNIAGNDIGDAGEAALGERLGQRGAKNCLMLCLQPSVVQQTTSPFLGGAAEPANSQTHMKNL